MSDWRGAYLAVYMQIPEVWGKSVNAEHNAIFSNKTAGRASVKPGSGRQLSVFPRTSEISKRKYAANSGTPDHTALFT